MRKLSQFHTLLAGFALPGIIVFIITGTLYTFSIRGNYETKNLLLELPLAPNPPLSDLLISANNILEKDLQSNPPSGEPNLKKVGTSWQFEWTGTNADLIIEPTEQANSYKVSYKKTTLHRFLVQLHKAKGGPVFKYYVGLLALSLFILFASGIGLALTRPKLKKPFTASFALGLLALIICAVLS